MSGPVAWRVRRTGSPRAAPESFPAWFLILRNRPVTSYYTAALADELIVAHNSQLRRELGPSVEEARALDMPSR